MWIRSFRPLFAAWLAVAVTLSTGLPALAAPSPAAAPVPAGWRTVTFQGVSVAAPASWPLTDFTAAASQSACARLDVHAVYLGSPATPDCPSHLVAHTETVQIAPATTATTQPLSLTGGTPEHPDITVISARSRYAVTVTSGTDPAIAKQIAATVTFAAATKSQAAPRQAAPSYLATPPHAAADIAPPPPTPVAPTPPTPAPPAPPTTSAPTPSGTIVTTTYTGRAFDACSAPSASTMQAWLASPYRGVGIYVGGALRGCAQPNLTMSWVDQVLTMGWRLIPTYVGPQAPCTKYSQRVSTDLGIAGSQGAAAADDAISSVNALGMGAGTPIYYDMEGYSSSDPTTLAACRAGVLAFLQAWTVELHARGYLSGVYSGVTSGIRDLANAAGAGGYTSPDAIWMARWIDLTVESPNTAHQPGIPDTYLAAHQRIHQYLGGHTATYAGVQINIDSNQADAPLVAATGPLWQAPSTCTTNAAAAPGTTGTTGTAATQLVGTAPAPTLALPRVAGTDRFATAAMLAESYTADQSGVPGNAIVIANGEDYKGGFDALSASYLAGRVGAPILLTRSAQLPASTATAVCDVLAGGNSAQRTIYVIGGSDSVSAAVASQLASVYQPGGVTVTVSRVAGASRYETSAKIAQIVFTGGGVGSVALTRGGVPAPTAILASGEVNADALSAGPISAALNIPVLLSGDAGLDPSVSAALSALGVRNVLVLGGSDRISDAVLAGLRASGMTVIRVAGADRYETASLLASFGRSTLGLSGSVVALANGVTGFPDALTAGPYLGRYGGSLLLVPDSGALPPFAASFLSGMRGSVTSVQALGQGATVPDAALAAAQAAAGL